MHDKMHLSLSNVISSFVFVTAIKCYYFGQHTQGLLFSICLLGIYYLNRLLFWYLWIARSYIINKENKREELRNIIIK